MKEKIIQIISEITKISLHELKQKADIPKMWPSLMHIEIIIALEDEFNIRFDVEDIAKMDTVNEIIQHVSNELG